MSVSFRRLWWLAFLYVLAGAVIESTKSFFGYPPSYRIVDDGSTLAVFLSACWLIERY